jgi:hypothetical protein
LAQELVDALRVLLNGGARAGEVLIRVQARRVALEEQAPVPIVRAGLRHDLDLRAGVAAELGRVVVRKDADLLDGLLVRRDDGRAAPGLAAGVHAVDLDVVRLDALAGGRDRRPVLGRKDAVVGPAGTDRVRKVRGASRSGARAETENARAEPQQLERVTAELR